MVHYIYIEGSQVIINKCTISLTIDFVLAKSAGPDELPHNVALPFAKVLVLVNNSSSYPVTWNIKPKMQFRLS